MAAITPNLLAGTAQPGESAKAIVACNDYLRLGPGRSLGKLLSVNVGDLSVKTPTLRTLERWSSKYCWLERAGLYDTEQERQKQARIEQLRSEGLAADYRRIEELNQLYDKLRAELDRNGLWYDDIKLSARGDRVRVKVFHKHLIDSLRGVLDDIAAEVGGRKQTVEHSGGIDVEHHLDEWKSQASERLAQVAAMMHNFDEPAPDKDEADG